MSDPQYCCGHCVTEGFMLATLEPVDSKDEKLACDFCEDYSSEDDDLLFDVDDLAELIDHAVWSYFAAPEDILFRDKENPSGWSHEPDWGADVIRNEIPEFSGNDNLIDFIADKWSEHHLVKREFMQLDFHEALTAAWDKFSQIVMHESRYFVQSKPVGYTDHMGSEIPGQEFLQTVDRTIRSLGLIRTVNPSEEFLFYRSRITEPDDKPTTAGKLGSPPYEYAKYSNRMSPAGIPMFYGGTSEATAIAETVQSWENKPALLTTSCWRPATTLRLLDLRQPQGITSFYDTEHEQHREGQLFLRGFANDLSQPVGKDGYEHVDYAPTQVLTEYFRRVFELEESEGEEVEEDYSMYSDWNVGIHGIIYKSSILEGGDCVVIFANPEQ